MAESQSIPVPAVEYRDIPGFPGYRVGSDGSIWTRLVRHYPGRRKCRGVQYVIGTHWNRRIPQKSRAGYHHLVLQHESGRRRTVKIHRLVLLAFAGPCPSGMQCRHLNGIKTDNRLENLRWGTPGENLADKKAHGTVVRGEDVNRCKLSEADVLAMRAAHQAGGISFAELGRRYGVTDATVHKAVTGKTWQHLSDNPDDDQTESKT